MTELLPSTHKILALIPNNSKSANCEQSIGILSGRYIELALGPAVHVQNSTQRHYCAGM